ncbi:hypothetical protein [Cryobacterium sp. GrIS_2_6]|uniref:hypothetical protein n=1 Tax=Cryobacterium sp. GrIS_2_6 TaxID=3162785 RepID=UPI002E0690F0|nr:hypothetical protein [Cryobacterium psychrotolerans]
MNEQERFTPSPERMKRTAHRFESRIVEGITAAQTEQREIDHLTARMIAHALGRALGRGSALAEFGRSGEGTYEALREEYLPLYSDPTTPAEIREWIDWFGTHLVEQTNRGSDRRFMTSGPTPDLAHLLVPTTIELSGRRQIVQVPATKSEAEITALAAALELLPTADTNAFRAFLRLADVDASATNLVESFHDSYISSFGSIDEALYGLTELDEWETDLHNFAADRGILPDAVSLNLDLIEAQTRDIYDIVEMNGVLYVFNK